MKNHKENNVTIDDIHSIRASLLIPLGITIICSFLDLMFQFKFGRIISETLSKRVIYIFGVLISYFFPSFLASAISLWWQYYFTDKWSGIKNNKGFLLSMASLTYVVFYIVYLLYSDTIFVFVFTLINILYVWCVLSKCIDKRMLKSDSLTPQNEITKSPSG